MTWQRAGISNGPVQKCQPLDGILQCSLLFSLLDTMPFFGCYWYNVCPLARSLKHQAARRQSCRGLKDEGLELDCPASHCPCHL